MSSIDTHPEKSVIRVQLGQNVVLSDVPDARVTFSTPIPVARRDLGQVLESILESHGLVLVQSAERYLSRPHPMDLLPERLLADPMLATA